MKGDWIDRLNNFWSVLLLSACAVVSFVVRMLPLMSVRCFCPVHFTDSHVSYAQATLQHSETYYLPYSDQTFGIPSKYNVSYHHWIPIILFLQALAFKIPQSLISLMKSFICPTRIFDTYLSPHNPNRPNTANDELTNRTARLLAEFLSSNNILITCMEICKKILFCINLIAQLVFLQMFFNSGRHIVPENLGNKTVVPTLPRGSILHDFAIQYLQNVYRYTVQCVMPANEVYDKIFVFLWYWVLLVAILSFINTALWVFHIFIPAMSRNKVKVYLKSVDIAAPERDLGDFVSSFLGWDGSHLLYLLSVNGFELQAAGLTHQLWIIYQERLKQSTVPGATVGQLDTKMSGAALDVSAE
ncbi:innexin unc-9-like [Gigantopelta aegis]|uniref:innexin unc-9-like n=1 Tax=Gigantopelta aegis TaxID=1735272 RepID=UPI001B8885E9|nr:innexin unc-9-like [Gigantopelta aegis]